MSALEGRVGPWKITWLRAPAGSRGEGVVRVSRADGKDARPAEMTVRWERDASGLRIESAVGVFGFDFEGSRDDERRLLFRMRERGGPREWEGVRFLREADVASAAAGAGKKKDHAIKAQMPGKVVKVLVEEGGTVSKDQPLLVLEAMKMENELRAPHAGVVKKVAVRAGAAVETGALLLQIGQPE